MFGGYWRGFGKGEGLGLFLVRRSLVDIEGDLAKEKDLPFSWLRGVIYKLLDYETFKKLLSFLSFFSFFADFLDFGRVKVRSNDMWLPIVLILQQPLCILCKPFQVWGFPWATWRWFDLEVELSSCFRRFVGFYRLLVLSSCRDFLEAIKFYRGFSRHYRLQDKLMMFVKIR